MKFVRQTHPQRGSVDWRALRPIADAYVPDAGARDEYAGLAGLRGLASVLRDNAHEILDGRDG